MPGQVFVCHASKDAARATRVVTVLEAHGIPCWIAPRDIPAGAQYTQSILEGLAAAPALVLVFSHAANDSPHVRRELETVVGKDTPMLPIRLEDVEPSPSLRYFIGTSQWLDTIGVPARTWEPDLVAGMRRLLGGGAPEEPAPPVVPPATLRPAGTAWGRDELIAEVASMLDAGHRLVTLTGPGGIGKTRLAAEVAALRPEIEVLDDAEPGQVDPVGQVLATSRLPLGLPGEQVVPIPPLDDEASVQLFREAAAGSSVLDRQAVRAGEVCRLLGGFPLGLVLAGRRLRVVGLERLHAGLTTGLDLVADLAVALQWSLDHVDETQRGLLLSLSVFHGPVGLDAVEAVAPGSDPVDPLLALVDAGLVIVDLSLDEPRYVLPHPVRLLAQGLDGDTALDELHERAAAYWQDRARDWQSRLDTAQGPEVVAAFTASAPDIDAAVDRDLAAGRTATATDLLLAGSGLWIASGRMAAAERRCRRLLETLAPDSAEAARLHAVLGRLAYHLNRWPDAEAELRTALSVGEQAGDAVAVAAARCYLSGTLVMSGKADEGRALADVAAAETEALGLYPQSVETLSMVAVCHAISGELELERSTHERRLELVRRHGDVARTADTLDTLAQIAIDDDDLARAHRYATEALGLAGRLPVKRRDATLTLARALIAEGDLAEAGRLLTEGVALSLDLSQDHATAQCLRVGGVLADSAADPALAIRLFAAAQVVSPSPTGTTDPPERDFLAALTRAREALGEHDAQQEWTLGGALPMARMLEQLAGLTSPNGS